MIKKKVLESGLTLITKNIPATQAVTVLILVKTGSRNEIHSLQGLAHFQEHMFFKGGKKYTDSKAVSQAIDSVGGEFNAFTAKEYVGYYVKVEKSQIHLALDVLSDMMLEARFDEKEINKERGVILEEYAMYQDTPMYQVGWEFESLLFGDQPLGWDQIGTEETIKNMKREDFISFKNTWYQPSNTAISITGNFDENTIFDDVASYFKFSEDKKVPATVTFDRPNDPHRLKITHKKTEQTHLVFGTYGFEYGHKLRNAGMLLSVILGGNMSSRLFLKVREENGYAYYIRSNSDSFADAGSFYARAGVNINKAKDAIRLIKQEFENVAQYGVTQDEIDRAKSFAIGQMTLAYEDSEYVANSIGRRYLFESVLPELEERLEAIRKITIDEVNMAAKELFSQKLFLSLIGPHTEEDFRDIII